MHSTVSQEDLAGCTALVTGAASGIGLETVHLLAERGARVVLLDRAEAALRQAVEALTVRWGDRFDCHVVDVGDAAAVETVFAGLGARGERLDVLVCAAGVLRTGRLDQMPPDEWDAVFRVNVAGVYHVCRQAIALMRRDEPSAALRRIVLLSSASGLHPKVALGAYSASKAAVINLVRILAAELALHGITVNGVAPGTIATPMVAAYMSGEADSGFRLYGAAPIGRMGTPRDVALAIGFLASAQADFISGAVLPVDGAATAVFPSA